MTSEELNDSRYVLVGVKDRIPAFPPEEDKEALAIFTSRELAVEYAERSRLVRPMRTSAFVNKSLLTGCVDYEIEYYEELPVNPSPPN